MISAACDDPDRLMTDHYLRNISSEIFDVLDGTPRRDAVATRGVHSRDKGFKGSCGRQNWCEGCVGIPRDPQIPLVVAVWC